MKHLFICFIISLSFVNCNSVKEISQKDVSMNFNGSFRVIKLNDENVIGKGLTFIIDHKNKRVSGNSGCNTYGTRFELSETNQISFESPYTTKMYCVENEKNDIEKNYIGMFSEPYLISFKKDQIVLEAVQDKSLSITLVKEE